MRKDLRDIELSYPSSSTAVAYGGHTRSRSGTTAASRNHPEEGNARKSYVPILEISRSVNAPRRDGEGGAGYGYGHSVNERGVSFDVKGGRVPV